MDKRHRPGIMALAVLGLTLGAPAVATSVAGPVPPRWQVYGNARFGYSICLPAELKAEREADNGDGRRFRAPDGASLTVFGGYDDQALGQLMAQERRQMERDGAEISYKAMGTAWYVLSGKKAGRIFYTRRIRLADGYGSYRLDYPVARARRWQAAIGTMNGCFAAR